MSKPALRDFFKEKIHKKDTHYSILGVKKDATDREIRVAYRDLARAYHPDKNKTEGAEEIFKTINTAQETLLDAEKRRHYDFVLERAVQQQSPRDRNPRSSHLGLSKQELFSKFAGKIYDGKLAECDFSSIKTAEEKQIVWELILEYAPAINQFTHKLFDQTRDVEIGNADRLAPLILHKCDLAYFNKFYWEEFRNNGNVNRIVDDKTLLEHALKYDKPDLVQFLIKNGVKLGQDSKDYRRTILHYVGKYDLPKVGKDFLENSDFYWRAETDVSSNIFEYVKKKDVGGYTALHHACAEGNEEVVKEIVSFYKRNNKSEELKSLILQQNSSKEDCLVMACDAGNKNILSSLVDELQGHDLKELLRRTRGETEDSALTFAVESDNPEIVNYLFDKNNKFGLKLDEGINHLSQSAFCLACKKGKIESAKALQEIAASQGKTLVNNAVGYGEKTPLELALQEGRVEMAGWLLSNNDIRYDYNKLSEFRTELDRNATDTALKKSRDKILELALSLEPISRKSDEDLEDTARSATTTLTAAEVFKAMAKSPIVRKEDKIPGVMLSIEESNVGIFQERNTDIFRATYRDEGGWNMAKEGDEDRILKRINSEITKDVEIKSEVTARTEESNDSIMNEITQAFDDMMIVYNSSEQDVVGVITDDNETIVALSGASVDPIGIRKSSADPNDICVVVGNDNEGWDKVDDREEILSNLFTIVKEIAGPLKAVKETREKNEKVQKRIEKIFKNAEKRVVGGEEVVTVGSFTISNDNKGELLLSEENNSGKSKILYSPRTGRSDGVDEALETLEKEISNKPKKVKQNNMVAPKQSGDWLSDPKIEKTEKYFSKSQGKITEEGGEVKINLEKSTTGNPENRAKRRQEKLERTEPVEPITLQADPERFVVTGKDEDKKIVINDTQFKKDLMSYYFSGSKLEGRSEKEKERIEAQKKKYGVESEMSKLPETTVQLVSVKALIDQQSLKKSK